MKKLFCLGIILAILMVIGIAYAGEKEELMGQKKYIEQKLASAEAEFQGFVKAYQVQIQTFQNDLRNITQRLSQIEQEEASKKSPKQEQGKNPVKQEEKK